MLELKQVNTYYGEFHAIRDMSFRVMEKDFFLVIGPNGHGKSTLLKTICGLLRPNSGRIFFAGEEITGLSTDKIVQKGLVYIPEARHLFTDMTVVQNLQLGAVNRNAKPYFRESLEYVYQLFPKLKEMSNRLVSTLSGGEARMVTIGRGIMSRAKLLTLDEPSFGLAPIVRSEVFKKINETRKSGLTLLLVEQNINQVIEFADRICLIEDGHIVFNGKKEAALLDDRVKEVFLG